MKHIDILDIIKWKAPKEQIDENGELINPIESWGTEELLHECYDILHFIEDWNKENDDRTELLECIHNLMGFFDTPIARRKLKCDGCDEVRKNANKLLLKNGINYRGV